MDEELLNELIEDTTLDDIGERYRGIVEIIGIRNFIKLSNYARGDELYFPKLENVIGPARNRRIKKEFNGYNDKELADRYNLTVKSDTEYHERRTASWSDVIGRMVRHRGMITDTENQG